MGYISVVPPYTLIVTVDRQPLNPRAFECFGKLICFNPCRFLGDPHTYENNIAFLKDIISDEKARDMDQMNTSGLLRAAEYNNVLMPVCLKEGSGISVSAIPIWTYDSLYALENRQIGWIYVSHDKIKKEFSADSLTPDLIENAKVLLYGEVDYYDNYLRGECYRFDLYQGGKPVTNYTGLLGTLEDVKKEIEDLVPDECRGITNKLRFVEPGSGFSFLPEPEKPIASSPETAQHLIPPSSVGLLTAESNNEYSKFSVDVDIFPINDPAGVTLAIVNIAVGNIIAINGISIERRSEELVVVMPKAKDINGRTYNVCAVISKELRALINTRVIEAYNSEVIK